MSLAKITKDDPSTDDDSNKDDKTEYWRNIAMGKKAKGGSPEEWFIVEGPGECVEKPSPAFIAIAI